jgi:Rrf2 family transcriptional regulator, iron-sulfur cluster assembly transcription factor
MRLELTRRGDYAIRAMLVLGDAAPGARTSARKIAAMASVPARFLPHVMGDLVRAGFVTGMVGRRGGYLLTPAGRAASVLDVVDAIEGDSRQRTCVLRGGPCGGAGGTCAVHATFAEAQESLRSVLAATSLAGLSTGESGVPSTARRRPSPAR